MGRPLNLAGKRFVRLFVVDLAYIRHKQSHWNCECDCGQKVIVRASKLKSGRSVSCGCWKREGRHNSKRAQRVHPAPVAGKKTA